MLTAASSVKDRVEGLGLGADDYLPKPFDFTEMVARVQALGRRPGAALVRPVGVTAISAWIRPPGPPRGPGASSTLRPKEFAVLERFLLLAGGKTGLC